MISETSYPLYLICRHPWFGSTNICSLVKMKLVCTSALYSLTPVIQYFLRFSGEAMSVFIRFDIPKTRNRFYRVF